MDIVIKLVYILVFAITAIVALILITLIYMAIFYLLLKIPVIRHFALSILDRIEGREEK